MQTSVGKFQKLKATCRVAVIIATVATAVACEVTAAAAVAPIAAAFVGRELITVTFVVVKPSKVYGLCGSTI